MTKIGDNIRQRRLALGLTQEKLGIAAGGRSVNQINGYERGRSRPSAPVLADIAKALKTSPNELLGLPETPLPGNDLVGVLGALKEQLAKAFGHDRCRVTVTLDI